jgi:hypothetical protein
MAREPVSDSHPLRGFFQNLVQHSVQIKMGLNDSDVEDYLSGLITEFMHADASAIEEDGRLLDDVVDMASRGEMLLGAGSFAKERQVHKHIGDYLMFWGGLFPEHLKLIKKSSRPGALIDPVAQGKASYYFVSTFVYGDYASEAAMFRRMSDDFEAYLFALHLVREAWEGEHDEWSRGFRS